MRTENREPRNKSAPQKRRMLKREPTHPNRSVFLPVYPSCVKRRFQHRHQQKRKTPPKNSEGQELERLGVLKKNNLKNGVERVGKKKKKKKSEKSKSPPPKKEFGTGKAGTKSKHSRTKIGQWDHFSFPFQKKRKRHFQDAKMIDFIVYMISVMRFMTYSPPPLLQHSPQRSPHLNYKSSIPKRMHD